MSIRLPSIIIFLPYDHKEWTVFLKDMSHRSTLNNAIGGRLVFLSNHQKQITRSTDRSLGQFTAFHSLKLLILT